LAYLIYKFDIGSSLNSKIFVSTKWSTWKRAKMC